MKIYRCDRCRAELIVRAGIVGREFDYQGHFGTLAPLWRHGAVVDLCVQCMSAAEALLVGEQEAADTTARKGFFRRFYNWLIR